MRERVGLCVDLSGISESGKGGDDSGESGVVC